MPAQPEDVDRSAGLLAAFWVPFPILFALVLARVGIRLRIGRFGWDDGFMIIAAILYTVGSVFATLYAHHGGTRHLKYIRPHDLAYVVRYSYVMRPMGSIAAAFGKISIAILSLRLLQPHSMWRKQKVFLYLNIAVYVACTIVSCTVIFVQCSPPRALWEKVPGAKCWDPKVSTTVTIAQSSFGTWMDFVLAALPITFMWGLTMPLKTKVAVCLLLGLGVFAGICSAIKTAQMTQFSNRGDITWAVYPGFIWGAAEISLVIICGSIPPAKPLFDRLFKGKPIASAQRTSRRKSYRTRIDAEDDRPTMPDQSVPERSRSTEGLFLTTTRADVDAGQEPRSYVGKDGQILVRDTFEVASHRAPSIESDTEPRQQVRNKIYNARHR